MLSVVSATAQQRSTEIEYLSWVHLKESRDVLKGVLIATEDSAIQFVLSPMLQRKRLVEPYTTQRIPITTIETIKVRKLGDPGRGALWGAVVGAAAGAAVGYASGDDASQALTINFSAEEKAALGAILGIAPGMAIGALIGAGKTPVPVQGNQGIYMSNRKELQKYTLLQR